MNEHEHEHDHEQGQPREMIKLDGSAGVGDRARLTLITRDSVDGDREETFLIPLALLNMGTLNVCMQYNFIMGYKVVRQDKPQEDR